MRRQGGRGRPAGGIALGDDISASASASPATPATDSAASAGVGAVRSFATADLDVRAISLLLKYTVAPRPIAFVSTLSADGVPNLAPFSYFMAGGVKPPSVVFSPNRNRHGAPPDTMANIEATGEYVINVVTAQMADRMNATSASFPPEVSEWVEAPFAGAPSRLVRPPRVVDSPLALECRLHRIVTHGDGPSGANYVIGEVVYFHVAESVIADTGDGGPLDLTIDPRRIEYLARLGGDWYARVTPATLFELKRPGQG